MSTVASPAADQILRVSVSKSSLSSISKDLYIINKQKSDAPLERFSSNKILLRSYNETTDVSGKLCSCFSNLCAQELDNSLISRVVPNTVDIRSIGMGKTEVAANSESNALFTNPSLLALQEKGNIKFGSALHLGFLNDEYTDKTSGLSDTEVKQGYKPSFKFTNVSFSLPFHIQTPSVPISFAFGTGYQNAIDLSFTQYYDQEQQE